MSHLLICGSASCLWDDLRRVGKWVGDVMAINLAAFHVPLRLTHWVSIHPQMFLGRAFHWWMRSDIQSDLVTTHCSKEGEGVDRVWRFPQRGHSGYFACMVAYLMRRYDGAILAGMPMHGGPRFYDDQAGDSEMGSGWSELPADFFRSVSGATCRRFGYPSQDMLGHA